LGSRIDLNQNKTKIKEKNFWNFFFLNNNKDEFISQNFTRTNYKLGKCNIFELVGKYYKESKIEEKKEVEKVEGLKKATRGVNMSKQRQRKNVQEINELTADFLKHITSGWNDNELSTLQVSCNEN